MLVGNYEDNPEKDMEFAAKKLAVKLRGVELIEDYIVNHCDSQIVKDGVDNVFAQLSVDLSVANPLNQLFTEEDTYGKVLYQCIYYGRVYDTLDNFLDSKDVPPDDFTAIDRVCEWVYDEVEKLFIIRYEIPPKEKT
jgi:hypothetical protein